MKKAILLFLSFGLNAHADCASVRKIEAHFLGLDYTNAGQREKAGDDYIKMFEGPFRAFEQLKAGAPERVAEFKCLVGASTSAAPFEEAGGGGGASEIGAWAAKEKALSTALQEELASFPEPLKLNLGEKQKRDLSCRKKLLLETIKEDACQDNLDKRYPQKDAPEAELHKCSSNFEYESCIGFKSSGISKRKHGTVALIHEGAAPTPNCPGGIHKSSGVEGLPVGELNGIFTGIKSPFQTTSR